MPLLDASVDVSLEFVSKKTKTVRRPMFVYVFFSKPPKKLDFQRLKPAFHDADTDTDSYSPDTPTSLYVRHMPFPRCRCRRSGIRALTLHVISNTAPGVKDDVTNRCIGLTSTIGLSEFKTWDISYILNIGVSFAVRLFTVAIGVVFMQKE